MQKEAFCVQRLQYSSVLTGTTATTEETGTKVIRDPPLLTEPIVPHLPPATEREHTKWGESVCKSVLTMCIRWGKRLVLKTQRGNWGVVPHAVELTRRGKRALCPKRFLRYTEQKLNLNYFRSFVAVLLEMRWGNSLWKNPAATEDSCWFTLPSSSPLPAEGQTSPRSSIKLIRCNFSDRKLYKDVSRAGRNSQSSRQGPLKLKLNFVFPFLDQRRWGGRKPTCSPKASEGFSRSLLP